MERGRYVQPDTDESPLLGTMGAAGSVSKSTLDLMRVVGKRGVS